MSSSTSLAVDSWIICFPGTQSQSVQPVGSTSHVVDSWIRFALQKEVHMLGLDIRWGHYAFPNIEKMLSYSPAVNFLRSLQLVSVDTEDMVVHYILASSCSHLEEFCINDSFATKNPPNLKVLEIIKGPFLQTLEISAVNLVSLAYKGDQNNLLLKEIPDLHEQTLGDGIYASFISESHKYSNYSVQLVKFRLNFCMVAPPDLPPLCSLKRLELLSPSLVGRNLPFLSSFIKASLLSYVSLGSR